MCKRRFGTCLKSLRLQSGLQLSQGRTEPHLLVDFGGGMDVVLLGKQKLNLMPIRLFLVANLSME